MTTLMNIDKEPTDAEFKMIMAEVAGEAKAKYLISKKRLEELIKTGIEQLNKSEKA